LIGCSCEGGPQAGADVPVGAVLVELAETRAGLAHAVCALVFEHDTDRAGGSCDESLLAEVHGQGRQSAIRPDSVCRFARAARAEPGCGVAEPSRCGVRCRAAVRVSQAGSSLDFGLALLGEESEEMFGS